MVQIRTLKPVTKIRLPPRPTRAVPGKIQYKIVIRRNVDHPPPTPQPTPCRLWQGVEGTDGYGRRKVRGDDGRMRSTSMHRWVMEQLSGHRLPPWVVVLHACDNRLCYRAEHLSLGTVQDNNADMRAKGRGTKPPVHHFRGEAHPMAKLNAHQVRKIKGHYQSGLKVKTIAEMFDVAPSTIRRIVTGMTWATGDSQVDLVEEAKKRVEAAAPEARGLGLPERIKPVKKMQIRRDP
jgi:hypothetical protein